MSHFTTLVVIDGTVLADDLEVAVYEALAPFSENIDVPLYISNTKAELIANQQKEIEEYRDGMYADYIADPVKYEAECRNPNHMRYLTAPAMSTGDKAAEVATLSYSPNFADKLLMLGDETALYAEAIRWFEPEELDAEGNQVSTYNPKSQWDWWVIGGRWENMLNNTAGRKAEVWNGSNYLRRRDLRMPESTFAYLTKEGNWVEKGSMGWFGMVTDGAEQEDWDKAMAEFLLTVPGEDWLVVVDCHI